ncbi:MAG: hypothetical protein IH831_09250 [Planctomycetes bacterium]|nr:hypothetical protein [Planctomycetota bacterium]
MAALIMTTFFISERWLRPVIQHLLDEGLPSPYTRLPESKLQRKMMICFGLQLIGTEFIAASIDGWAPGIGSLLRNYVGAAGHFDSFTKGVIVTPDEELALIDGNPVYELYDFGYVDDIRNLVRQDNLVAINNALMVDLTGQVASETVGHRVLTGVGGQTAFSIAANYSRGGRCITVLPSSHIVDGQRLEHI